MRFKIVNDTLGHEAGDRLLRDVSRRLLRVGRRQCFVWRGPAATSSPYCAPMARSRRRPKALAGPIVAAMAEPIDIDGTQFRLSASLGLAFHPSDGTTAVEIFRHADTAMYQAKSRGRGLSVRFDAEMDRTQHARCRIEHDLRRALTDREIEVWFQPRFETLPRRISGFEALARWRHPERWLHSSAPNFIPDRRAMRPDRRTGHCSFSRTPALSPPACRIAASRLICPRCSSCPTISST